MGMIARFVGRIAVFQPSTWFAHLIIAWAIWAAIDITPYWMTAALLTVAVLIFAYREWLNYQHHQAAGDNLRVWIGDGIGDLIGPVTVLVAALTDPWIAHSIGLGILGIGTVIWVGFGYSGYGGQDA